MRSIYRITLAGAIALAAVACNKDVVQDNPDYNPETKEVTAQFVISVNTSSPQTKMKPDAVQKSSIFRGISNGHILLFKSYNGTTPLQYVLDPALKAEKDYPFGTLMSSGDITASANQTESSNRILQMSVPTGVNVAMIYGIAPKNGANNAEGKMNYVVSDTPSGTSFSLSRRIGDTADDITAYDHTGALMVFVLNRILSSMCDPIESYLTYSNLPKISWRELGLLYEHNNAHLHGTDVADYTDVVAAPRSLTALEESLGRAYSEFTYIKDGEYRAGSSTAIKKMMQDMFSVVESIKSATPGNAAEANAKRLANTIETRINNYFDVNWEYKDITDIHTYVVTTSSLETEANWTSKFGKAKDLNKYPYGDFSIPEGAAQLSYDKATGRMSYKHPNQALLSAGNPYDPRNYSYPVELAYCVNSPLRISSKDGLKVEDFINGVSPWMTDANWIAKGWNPGIGAVEQSTRGIAVRDNVSYGVALLQMNLSYDETNPFTNYADNRKAMTGEDDRTFSKDDAKLSLKGVLIGGQNNEMDWQFLRKNTTPDPSTYSGANADIDPSLFNHVIYDDALNDFHVPTQAPNYTLVFDNYNSVDPQNKVKVALEFVNGGDAFWGKDNLIPAGGTFYLVGELDPANPKTGSTINWASATRQIPPTDASGASRQIARVFIQDFMTIANFKLNSESLKKAYLSVPDLRSAQMSFGLSVDLEWRSGFAFDVTF